MHNAHKWMQNDKRSKMTRMAHRNKTHTTKTRQCPPRSKMTKLRPKKKEQNDHETITLTNKRISIKHKTCKIKHNFLK